MVAYSPEGKIKGARNSTTTQRRLALTLTLKQIIRMPARAFSSLLRPLLWRTTSLYKHSAMRVVKMTTTMWRVSRHPYLPIHRMQ